jgi:hypothetical protein
MKCHKAKKQKAKKQKSKKAKRKKKKLKRLSFPLKRTTSQSSCMKNTGMKTYAITMSSKIFY